MEWIKAARLVAPYAVAMLVGASMAGGGMHLLLAAERAQHAKELAEVRARNAEGALSDIGKQLEKMAQAQASTQALREEQQKSYEELQTILAGLRTDTASVRDSVALLPQRFNAFSRATIERYASACTAVFGELAQRGAGMAQRGAEMAQRGAEIAKAADGHYADDKLKLLSWPHQAQQHGNSHNGETAQ